ncbi:glycosyltransferase [Trebonia sp.]|uniref:glycosyltransferase n=1 Tax=Trebonia sp. TaxID=2767075 RepID=UPI002615B3D6|nr:glycosyltransferase [Trebonia sp.]
MRIVRLANYVGPRSGGMRTALRELGAGYLAAGHEPVLVVPGRLRGRGDEQTAQGRVITRYGPVVPFTGGYRALLARRGLAALLTELRPDLIEVSDRTTLRWTGRWAREHGVPAVMVSHESLTGLLSLPADVSGMSRWRSRLLANMGKALADAFNRRSVRAYQRIVCTTRWAAAEFERIGAPNLTRIPLGVDLELFSPERYSCTTRDAYAGQEQTLLVHCGRLSVEKKPHRSLAAVAGLRAAGVDAVLVVAGDGPLRTRLERAARRRSLPVRFAGFITDPKHLATLLASADVVVAPGPVETFGLAALEALACGTPVVVSAASALPEVIGTAGVAVDGEDFAGGVRAVLARDPEARRGAARTRAEEFGWPASVAAFLAVHEALNPDSSRSPGQVKP